ncbi:hypothetical protein, conserved [Eimeria tenella]|uniref:DNA endonuclease activator Ctp1 C-terminal domain-containing protein n=1 Tax=Eimeria tenella TaxID=5802 RepID=U6KQY4_EIMTE|nr:hypothetical protein, conserved [Eimeria tenella]CDJ38784.1 hypothetical protein, conserved [Eimeria tenella]|eukprot:XP_013229540.1 hypothetical protein, conserved [Eimeria tenella]
MLTSALAVPEPQSTQSYSADSSGSGSSCSSSSCGRSFAWGLSPLPVLRSPSVKCSPDPPEVTAAQPMQQEGEAASAGDDKVDAAPRSPAGAPASPPPKMPSAGEPATGPDGALEGLPASASPAALLEKLSELAANSAAHSQQLQCVRMQHEAEKVELQRQLRALESRLSSQELLLFEVLKMLRAERPHAHQWLLLEAKATAAAAVAAAGQSNGTAAAHTSAQEQQRQQQEEEEEESDQDEDLVELLRDKPTRWARRLHRWSACIDHLPLLGAPVSPSMRLSSGASQASAGSSNLSSDDATVAAAAAAAGVPPSSSSSSRGLLDSVEEGYHTGWGSSGLRVALLSPAGKLLSAAAVKAADTFRNFLAHATVRQEAWLRTFASFALTAAPVEALARARQLHLRLLEDAVALPASDLLLLVAEWIQPDPAAEEAAPAGAPASRAEGREVAGGGKPHMRVLCLLERAAAAACELPLRRLKREAGMAIFAFEPFSVCVQLGRSRSNNSSRSSRSSSRSSSSDSEDEEGSEVPSNKKLTVPICSIQGLRLVSPSAAPDSSKSSNSNSSSGSAASVGSCEGSRDQWKKAKLPGSETATQQRTEAAAEPQAQGERRIETERQTERKRQTEGDRQIEGEKQIETDKEQQKKARQQLLRMRTDAAHPTLEQQQQQKAGGQEGEKRSANPTQINHSTCSSSSSGSSSSSSSKRSRIVVSSAPIDGAPAGAPSGPHSSDGCMLASKAGGKEAEAAVKKEIYTNPDAPVQYAHKNEDSRKTDGKQTRLLPNAAGAGAAAPAGRSTAAAALTAGVDGESRRGVGCTSVRCCGLSVQQQLEQQQQQLPRVRASVPRQGREQLPGFECEQCCGFYGLLEQQGEGHSSSGSSNNKVAGAAHSGRHKWRRTDADTDTDTDTEAATNGKAAVGAAAAAASTNQRRCSRHRHFVPPPSTPPGFWDL